MSILDDYLNAHDMTRYKLAQASGIGASTWAAVSEKPTENWKLGQIYAIADAVNQPPERVLLDLKQMEGSMTRMDERSYRLGEVMALFLALGFKAVGGQEVPENALATRALASLSTFRLKPVTTIQFLMIGSGARWHYRRLYGDLKRKNVDAWNDRVLNSDAYKVGIQDAVKVLVAWERDEKLDLDRPACHRLEISDLKEFVGKDPLMDGYFDIHQETLPDYWQAISDTLKNN